MSSHILNHPLYTQTTKNLERTAVRDKILRLIQYFSRFLSYYTYRKGYSGVLVGQLKALTKNLSLARKAFRAGKPLGFIKTFVQELSNQTSNPVVHATTLSRSFAMGSYLTLDSVNFLQAIGSLRLKPATAQKVQDWANRFWMLSILSNIVAAVYKSKLETQRLKTLETDEKSTSDEVAGAQAALRKSTKVLIWNLIDLLIPLASLKILNLNDGIVGLAGTITAYLGLRDVW